ncbi:hypothetical protein BKG91_05820 [Rodentibacter caecimuris]|uniref:hypothetical protein n=1 Tax=Rodentibacter caecimuris TaxID=1796644 RepID=UPI0007509872|nr:MULTISPECIES: hypothetical protein [Pasteurellaceae]MCQ9124046.1 hypothetical protein [Rodentibacter heylii]MCR1838116.1 hypothetical protein [Pasteurella caecimuris]MCU0107956.1 hypothetical protein [Pasteurella caecimuris]MCX2961647.1 hypothetical protein [Rodentibacter heylii]OOF74685.1 hypothetical protein BKG91_05820 [Rodentibacter heylii]
MKKFLVIFLLLFFSHAYAGGKEFNLYAWVKGKDKVFSIHDKKILGYGKLYQFLVQTTDVPKETKVTVYVDSKVSFYDVSNLLGLLQKIGYETVIFVVNVENNKMVEYVRSPVVPFEGNFPK